MNPFDLKDRLNSIVQAKGQVVVLSLNELNDIIANWESEIRRRQTAENALASAAPRLPASAAFA